MKDNSNRTILVVGRYFPENCAESLLTHFLALDFKTKGWKTVLLSDAWTEAKEESHIDYYTNAAEEKPFDKSYYLDPVQLRLTNRVREKNMCLYGLCCDVIRREQVDAVVFTDLFPFGFFSVLLHDEFPHVKRYLYLASSSYVTSATEPSLCAGINQIIRHFDNVYCAPNTAFDFPTYFPETPYSTAYPFEPVGLADCEDSKLLAFGDIVFHNEESFLEGYIKKLPESTSFWFCGNVPKSFSRELVHSVTSKSNLFKILNSCNTILLINSYDKYYVPLYYMLFALMGKRIIASKRDLPRMADADCFTLYNFHDYADSFLVSLNHEVSISTVADIIS